MSKANRCLNQIEEHSNGDEDNENGEEPLGLKKEQHYQNQYISSDTLGASSSTSTGSLDNQSNEPNMMTQSKDVFSEFLPYGSLITTQSTNNSYFYLEGENDINGNLSSNNQMQNQTSSSDAPSSSLTSPATSPSQLLSDYLGTNSPSAAEVPSSGFRRRSAPVTKNMRPDPAMIKMLKKIRDIHDEGSADSSD